MTNISGRYGVLGALLTFSMACSEVFPPTPTSARIPTPPPPDHIPTFPAVLYAGLISNR